MKKILMFVVILIAPVLIRAAQPVSVYPGLPESNYGITHSTILVSVAVTTDTAVSGYREICTWNLSSSVTAYYKVDSTATISLNGYPIPPLKEGCLEYNGTIYWSLTSGASSIDLKRIIKRK